ncbi:MAG: hypothetical protein DRQ08_04580 [Candidatus Latescibacterota bacterium]|nr:MAG: hypothetical protein DRQ08_04580 [Candidatus Latescibacterota bacterium]
MTEPGSLPKEWKVVRLEEVAQPRNEIVHPEQAQHLRYVGLEHIDPGDVKLKRWGYPAEVRSAKHRFYTGDILYGKLRPYLDKAILAEWDGICSTDIIVLSSKEKIDKLFLANLLHTQTFVRFATATMTGVNHPRTSWSALKSFPVPLPPLPEQRAIAYVLRIVQRAKEATERVITATRELKKSLMRHLFTYGPVPLDQADQVPLKETEIGPVPEHWEVVRLGEVVTKTRQMDPRKTPNWWFKYVDVSSISKERLCIQGYIEYRGKEAPSRARKIIRAGDVLFATVRPYLRRIAVVPPELDGNICSTAFCVIRAKPDLADPMFLFFVVSDDNFVRRVSEHQRGSSYPAVTDSDVLNEIIPYPPLTEQHKIARILQAVDRKIEAEENRKAALEALFKILLHHLMTGKVRVPLERSKPSVDGTDGS